MPIVPADNDAIARAVDVLRAGGVVAFPTETVYGLGADTFSDSAIARVYELKGRPFDNPLIAHVLDIEQAKRVVQRWDARCESLAHRFWPGPLTIVVPKHDSVPMRATAGYSTIAVRSPAHPIARQLLKAFASPISAPSANRSGHVSPTRAQHVADDFADADLLILDGGASEVGIESTVLDLSAAEPRILRPGSVSAEEIGEALGAHVPVVESSKQLASPGTAPRHYAPRTPAETLERDALLARMTDLSAKGERICAIVLQTAPGIDARFAEALRDHAHVLIEMPCEAEPYAAQLYDALRRADASGCTRILIERPTAPGPIWDVIRNRLSRIGRE